VTPVYSYLVLQGWHGSSSQLVVTIGDTPKRFRIMALARTRLAGRGRWLDPGQTALVPKSAVRHGEHSKPYVPTGTSTPSRNPSAGVLKVSWTSASLATGSRILDGGATRNRTEDGGFADHCLR
jgi:hypothetical protein